MEFDTYSSQFKPPTEIDSSEQPKQRSSNPLSRAANRVINYLLTLVAENVTQVPEPIVRQTKSREGKLIWNIYDPLTEQTFRFYSEEDALRWFAQRGKQ